MQQKKNIESLAVISRNVETVSQNTNSEVQAIATPVHRMDSRFDLLLQKEEDSKTALYNLEFQTRQNHKITLDIYRTVSEQYNQSLQNDSTFHHSLQGELCTALVELGAEQQLLRNEIEISGQKREGEVDAMAARMDDLVRISLF